MNTKNKNQHISIWIICLLLMNLLFPTITHAASPLAGTLIKNQATATYKDASGVEQVATSNLVETLIQHVAAMDLTQDQTRPGVLGNTVYFPHVLTNTGNDVDSFKLTATNNIAGDQYDFDDVKMYADANQDGIPDSDTEISSTGNLSAQEEFYFVVATALPSVGPSINDQGQITVTGESDFDSNVTQSNEDTVTISNEAIIEVTKSMSASTGYSPSSEFTVTLRYENTGVQAATNVTLIDALPTGMSYVAGSAKWSETGVTVLTDSNKNDDQTGVIYCAYHADCSGLPSNADSTQQVTAIIGTVAAGDSGTLVFKAQISSSIAASTLHNTADYEYNNGSGVVPRIPSNTVPYEVLALPAVGANGSDSNVADDADNVGGNADAFIVASANLGETVAFDNIIRNKGNSVDTFDITLDTTIANAFPANTVFQLYKQDGLTPLLDTNSNGIVDTGPLVANTQFKVVLKAILPLNATLGNNNGAGFNVRKIATSSIDTSINDSVTDTLQSIVGTSVDLTNNAAGNAGDGVGAGPETNPVTTVTTAPGGKAVFNLFVNNTSAINSSYQLKYSMKAPFEAGKVETNWKILFYHDGGNNDCSTQGGIITSTGVIPAQGNKQVCAVVTLPANAIADKDANGNSIEHSIYFQAISILNGVNGISDIKHDAVIIDDLPALSIEPDQQGQIQPGNTVVYAHIISNNGNTPLECINISTQDSQTDWSSIIYKDVNENAQLDSGDIQLTDQVLNSGDSFSVLVKLFAPATVAMGTQNTTTLTVSGNQDDGDGNPATCNGQSQSDIAIDLTTVNESEVNIKKEQSADNDCDGVSDSGVFTASTFQVNPQACVIYRLTATNAGAKPVNNVRIDDAAPAFTTFHQNGGLPNVTQGNITGGLTGQDGSVAGGSVAGASITLQPSEKMVLNFGVRLD